MKAVALAVLFLSLIGCATTKNVAIDKAVAPTLKGKTVTLVEHKTTSFMALTAGKGMFAMIGVAAAIESGNKLVKECNIEDPASDISLNLAQELNSRYGLINKGQSNQVVDSKEVQKITKLAQGSDYTLDVMTTGWGFIYGGFKLSDYHVNYSGNFRLIDVAKSKIISEGICIYDTKKAGKPAVKYDDLLENNAAYIKQCLEEAATFCTDKISNELF